MKFPPFLHSHLRLTLLGPPPNRVFFKALSINPLLSGQETFRCRWNSLFISDQRVKLEDLRSVVKVM
jgi:hypothetical protein